MVTPVDTVRVGRADEQEPVSASGMYYGQISIAPFIEALPRCERPSKGWEPVIG